MASVGIYESAAPGSAQHARLATINEQSRKPGLLQGRRCSSSGLVHFTVSKAKPILLLAPRNTELGPVRWGIDFMGPTRQPHSGCKEDHLTEHQHWNSGFMVKAQRGCKPGRPYACTCCRWRGGPPPPQGSLARRRGSRVGEGIDSLSIKRNSCNVSPSNGDHPWILPTNAPVKR